MQIRRKGRSLLLRMTILGVVSGCTVTVNQPAAEVTSEAVVATTVPETTSSTAAPTTIATSTTLDSDGANPLGGNSPEDFLMPDVLCMNLQEAQDEIQDRGVFFSRSEDATGAGRAQLFDRNWVVVEQQPAPGQPITEGEALLKVVKIGESTGGRC